MITRIFLFLLSPIINACNHVLVYACQVVLISSLVLGVAFYLGWIDRWLWHVMEHELSKNALNGARLTVGSFEYDVIRGRLWASNVIVHSPDRHLWKWSSPVIARVGKVYVETNLVWVLWSTWFLWEEPPLEIYTLHVSDIQCFVERKHQVFNIHLLDPRNVIPDPRTLAVVDHAESAAAATAAAAGARDSVSSIDPLHNNTPRDSLVEDGLLEQQQQNPQQHEQNHQSTLGVAASKSSSAGDLSAAVHNTTPNMDHSGSVRSVDTATTAAAMAMIDDYENENNDDDDDDDDKDERTAQRLVNDMLLAVESLGQAAQHGSLPRALNEQRQQITQRLKKVVQATTSGNNRNASGGGGSGHSHKNNPAKAMKQGVKIVQHVSKAVVEKTQSVQKVVPPRRELKNQKIVYARFGRVIMDDVRVFTRNYKKSKLLSQQQQLLQQHHQRSQQQQQQAYGSSSNDGQQAVLPPPSQQPGWKTPPRTLSTVSVGTTTTSVSTTTAANTTTITTTAPLSPAPATPPIPSQQPIGDMMTASAGTTTGGTTASTSSLRDVLKSSTTSTSSVASAPAAVSEPPSSSSSSSSSSITFAWNKPIVVKRCAVRASEFCPPLAAKEDTPNAFPVLYQPMDKCMDAILKRVVADMARANNGRIFQTALGEVLDYWTEKDLGA